jgi:hypothetical protein
MCGSAALVLPPPPPNHPLPTRRIPRPLLSVPGFSVWLFLIGLSLIITPALRVYALSERQIPMFITDKGQIFLMQHPGYDKFLYFEISIDALLVLAAAALNILIYTHSRRFPYAMITYVVATFVYQLVTIAVLRSLFPDTVHAQDTYILFRYFIWGALTAGYLLFDPNVRAHFDQ